MVKSSQKARKSRKLPQSDETHMKNLNLTPYFMPPLRSGTRQKCVLPPRVVNILLEILRRQRKEIKGGRSEVNCKTLPIYL